VTRRSERTLSNHAAPLSHETPQGPWSLDHLDVEIRLGEPTRALVRLHHTDGRARSTEASAPGPIDALLQAIAAVTRVDILMRGFEVRACSTTEEAIQAEVVVEADVDTRRYRGLQVSGNTIFAAAHALIEIVNAAEEFKSADRRFQKELPNGHAPLGED
jgi:LeuA allosteric (dimerisation) domain